MKTTKVNISLPRVAQKHDYDCGAAALKSIYEYEHPEDKNDLSKYTRFLGSTKGKGTSTQELVSACKLLGLNFQEYHGMSLSRLQKEIKIGNPILCLIRSNDHGHFVVAMGCDEDNIFFEDPFKKKNNGYLPKKEFFKRWTDGDNHSDLKRFGLIFKVTRPKSDKKITAYKILGN